MLIEVYQDTACPWCRIGKRHLELALERWQGEPVEVRYRAFLLNPNIPPEGYDFYPYMRAKGGGRVPVEQFFAAPRSRGALVGLAFHFEKITRAPNTLLSHRLIALTLEEKKKDIVDAVFAAYFEHGLDIGDVGTLVDIAAAHGLEGETVRAALIGDAERDRVLAEAQEAHALDISGVPFFVFDHRYGLSGAQPVEIILEVMHKVIEAKQGV
ncbi:MAG: DsbA family oxidoreductase [Bellilinea sp.]|jgi:predicted DsbA family dithiol-disulfide isomerase